MSSVFIYVYPISLNYFRIFQEKFGQSFAPTQIPTQSHALRQNATKEEKLRREFLSWRQTPLTAEYNCFALQYDVICMYNNGIIRFINNACTYQKPQSDRRGRLPLQCLVVIMSHTYNFLKSLSKRARLFKITLFMPKMGHRQVKKTFSVACFPVKQ